MPQAYCGVECFWTVHVQQDLFLQCICNNLPLLVTQNSNQIVWANPCFRTDNPKKLYAHFLASEVYHKQGRHRVSTCHQHIFVNNSSNLLLILSIISSSWLFSVLLIKSMFEAKSVWWLTNTAFVLAARMSQHYVAWYCCVQHCLVCRKGDQWNTQTTSTWMCCLSNQMNEINF